MEDEEFETAANTSVGGMAGGLGQAFSPAVAAEQLAKLQQQYFAGQAGAGQARQGMMQSMAERFKKAEEDLRAQRFGMPSGAERLYALSQSFLSPQRMPGFHGMLDNVVPTLGRMASAQRESGEERDAALAKLRQEQAALKEKYALEGLDNEQKRLIELMKVYGPLAKGSSPQTTYDPFTRTVVDKNTGTARPVTDVPAPPPPEAVNAGLQRLGAYLQSPAATPEGKQQAVLNFAQTFRMNPAEVMRMMGVN
jgi:hypothetical protein